MTKAGRFPQLSVSPGPAEYLIKEFSPAEQYTFNKAANIQQINESPGPFEYTITRDNIQHFKNKTIGPPAPLIKQKTGGPGPGQYSQTIDYSIPSFKITKPVPQQKESENQPGPQSYNTEVKRTNKGVRIGAAERQMLQVSQTPAPNLYQIKGDFDFRQHNETHGKQYKFAQLSEPKLKQAINEIPGPGYYDTHDPRSVAYWIGTANRHPIDRKEVRGFPGPGAYNLHLDKGPEVKFLQQRKDTQIKKSRDPGPTSYEVLNTVGVIPQYNRGEHHPRPKSKK